MKEVKSPRKPFLIYALVVAVIILLLNGILFPNILEQRTEEVDYGTFMTMTEKREIGLVEVQGYENRIHGQGSEACVRDWSDE